MNHDDQLIPTPESIAAAGMKRPLLSLGAMTGRPEYIGERSQSLVDTFGTLLERPLKLVHGPLGCTDCETFISVPLHQYDAYLVTEHELSHCLFGTNKKLTDDFQIVAVERLLRRAGLTLTSTDAIEYKPMLEKMVHTLWNVLEDHRCCGLWMQLYPGGGSLLRNRWFDVATHEYEDADCEKNLLQYLTRTACGVGTPTAPPDFLRCDGPMRRALNLVEGVDAAACLAITARLIDDISDELLDNNPPPEKQQAAQQKLQAMKQAMKNQQGGQGQPQPAPPTAQQPQTPPPSHQAQPQKKSVNGMGEDDAQVPANKKNKVDAAQRILVNRLLTAKSTDAHEDDEGLSSFSRLLNAGAEKMEERIEQAKLAMAIPHKSSEDEEKDVVISASREARIPVAFVEPTAKLPSATSAAQRIRQHLEKVRMRAHRKLRDEGDELETEEYIEAKLGGEDLSDSEFFQQKVMEVGLEMMLLFDCSGSMMGHGLAMVEKAAADTVHACVGPKVKVTMWGYSDQIFVFKKIGSPVNARGLIMSSTCMVQALEVAAEWARASKSTRAIIHMTDGFPTSLRAKNTTGNVMTDLAAVLNEMRMDRIVVSNLAIGPKQYAQTYDVAFGVGGYTLLTGAADLRTALPAVAQKLVESHLKRGSR